MPHQLIHKEVLARYLSEGLSGSDIARRLGCTRQAVSLAIRKYGLSGKECIACGRHISVTGYYTAEGDKRHSRRWCSAECERIASNARHTQYYYNRVSKEEVA